MRVNYTPLWLTCINKDITPAMLRRMTGLSSATFTKLKHGEGVNLSVLVRIAEVLNCGISDIVTVYREEGGEHG